MTDRTPDQDGSENADVASPTDETQSARDHCKPFRIPDTTTATESTLPCRPDATRQRKIVERDTFQRETGANQPGESTRRTVLKKSLLAGLGLVGVATTGRARAQAGGGTGQWRFQTGGPLRSSPTVVDGTVYVGRYIPGALYAVDASTGTEQWRFDMGRDQYASPTVADGTVYIGNGDDDDGNLYAIDASTGTEQWNFQIGGEVNPSPTVVDGTVYVGDNDGSLYAVDALTGAQQWRFQTGSKVGASPTVLDSTVYVGSGNNLYAVDASTGNGQWQFRTDYLVYSSPTAGNGTVYVGSHDSNLYAVDASTGTEQWRFQTDDWVHSSPTVLDNTVYIGSSDSNLYAVDASTGTERWRFQTGGDVHSSPTVVDGTVYVGSRDNNLYAVDASTGTERWRFQTGGDVHSSPTVVNGTVYVGSKDGNLYAVAAGVDGSSEGSRVMLKTLGHHDGGAGNNERNGDDAAFVVESTTRGAEAYYTFTVDGEITDTRVADRSLENGDSIQENNDGTVTVNGYVGNLHGDGFRIDGDIVSFEKTNGQSGLRLELDGEDVTAELTNTVAPTSSGPVAGNDAAFVVESTTVGAEADYTFTVDGGITNTRVADRDLEDGDSIQENNDDTVTITGYVGDLHGDGFKIDGEIVSFEKTNGQSGLRLEFNGADVTEALIN